MITALIIVTPLCGLLFQCGCDWPWSGLDAGCNFHKPEADHRCPWCASLMTGILSTASAIIAGTLAAMAMALPLPLAMFRPVNEIALRTLSGLAVFALIAILTAGLAALWQNYPLELITSANQSLVGKQPTDSILPVNYPNSRI